MANDTFRKAKPKIHLNTKTLNKLAEDKTSLVEIKRTQYPIAMHPYHLNDINNSIKDILGKEISKHNERFNGILIGFKNVSLLSEKGLIGDDKYIHVWVEADFFVFKPILGKVLSGTINKLSEDHVGCLVHQTFNISLPNDQEGEHWLGNDVGLGSQVSFTITKTDFKKKLPYIRGKIVEILSEPVNDVREGEENGWSEEMNIIDHFDSDGEEMSSKPLKYSGQESSNTKKRKLNFSQDDSEITLNLNQTTEYVQNVEENIINESPKKKSKKSKDKQKKHDSFNDRPSETNISEVIHDEEEIGITPNTEGKKRKRKESVTTNEFHKFKKQRLSENGSSKHKDNLLNSDGIESDSNNASLVNEILANTTEELNGKSPKKKKKAKKDRTEESIMSDLNLEDLFESSQIRKKKKEKKAVD